MKVTISGIPGTGKSSVSEGVAEELGWDFMSSGNLFREWAKERDMTLADFEELSKKDFSIDRGIDERAKLYGTSHDNFVFEGHVSWHFIPDALKIKLDGEHNALFERIAKRDGVSIEVAEEQTNHREEAMRSRFNELYGIEDYSDDKHFDFVLDTTNIDLPTVIAKVKEYIVAHKDYV